MTFSRQKLGDASLALAGIEMALVVSIFTVAFFTMKNWASVEQQKDAVHIIINTLRVLFPFIGMALTFFLAVSGGVLAVIGLFQRDQRKTIAIAALAVHAFMLSVFSIFIAGMGQFRKG